MGNVTENVDIVVSETGSRKAAEAIEEMKNKAQGAADHIEDLGHKTEHTHSVMEEFHGILEKIGIALGVKEVIEYADAYSLLISRLHQVTKSSADLVEVEKQLYELSENSRTSFEANANFFLKAAVNADKLGISQKQLLETTELLNKAFVASGASEKQAEQGLSLLGRAFTTGRVDGRQLLTILKDFPVAAKSLADGLGVPTSALQGMAAKGLITAKSLSDAFIKSADQINKAYNAVAPTVSSALNVLKDAFVRQIGILDQNSGASGQLANALLFLAHHIDDVIKIVETATAAFLAFRAGLLLQSALSSLSAGLAFVQAGLTAYVARMEAAGVATTVFGRLTEAARLSMAGFNATLAANPIASVVTAAVLLAGAMQTLGPHIRFSNDELDRQRSLLGFVLGAIRYFIHSIEDVIVAIKNWWKGMGTLSDIMDAFNGKFQKYGDYVAEATKETDGHKIAVDKLSNAYGGDGGDGSGGLDNAIKKTTKSLQENTGALNINTTAAQGAQQVFENLLRAREKEDELIKKATEDQKKHTEALKQEAEAMKAMEGVTRDAMGNIIKYTEQMSFNAGKGFNKVSEAADHMTASIEKAVEAQRELNTIQSVGGGETFSESTSTIKEYAKTAGGKDTDQLFSAINTLSVVQGTALGPSKLNEVYNMLKQQPPEAARTIVANYPFLNNLIKGSGLPGFATGGAFTVGGNGGSDTSLVQFMGTPGENVEITTPAQRAAGKGSPGGRATHVTMVVNTPDANSFRRSQPQLIAGLKSKLNSVRR